MGYYNDAGYWIEEWDGDFPPNGQWVKPSTGIASTSAQAEAMQGIFPFGAGSAAAPSSPSPNPLGGGTGIASTSAQAEAMQGALSPLNIGSPSGAAGGTAQSRGPLPVGFSSWGEYDQWRQAFMQEHGGQSPEQYYKGDVAQAAEDRLASQIWAQQHGNPISWGNRPGDNRVPRAIFERLATASRSPDYGPRGPAAWADAADKIGGAIMAMQGKAYHPSQTTALGGGDDEIAAILERLMKPSLLSALGPVFNQYGMSYGNQSGFPQLTLLPR